MSKRWVGLMLLAALAIVALARLGQWWLSRDNAQTLDLGEINPASLARLDPADDSIQKFQDRVARDSRDYIGLTILGQLYLRKAGESGDAASYQRAEAAFTKALEINATYSSAKAQLASVLIPQHRFDEALALAREAYKSDRKDTQALATMGDAYLELGEYQEADDAYQELARTSQTPAVFVRLSHLAYLKGDTDEALRLMRSAALEEWKTRQPKESVAWHLVRLGELLFDLGKIDDSAEHYQAALKVWDSYYLAIAGLGKARAAQGRYEEAIRLYERAAAIIPQPGTLAALGDLYAQTGDAAKATSQYDTVEFIARLENLNQVIYNRELALFYANHDFNLDRALELAQNELAVRKDIYGYDALAWALYKRNRLDDAAEAMSEAMKLGTRHATLYYHAGMISYGRGETEQARDFLKQALDLNPHFSVLHAPIAKRTLDEITAKLASSKSAGAAH